jgi:DNA-binding transcriptional MerR regulator
MKIVGHSLISISEAAELSGIGVSTIWTWVRKRMLVLVPGYSPARIYVRDLEDLTGKRFTQ